MNAFQSLRLSTTGMLENLEQIFIILVTSFLITDNTENSYIRFVTAGIRKRLFQNGFEMASFVSFQIALIGIFSKVEFENLLLKVSSFQTFFATTSLLWAIFCKVMCNGQ